METSVESNPIRPGTTQFVVESNSALFQVQRKTLPSLIRHRSFYNAIRCRVYLDTLFGITKSAVDSNSTLFLVWRKSLSSRTRRCSWHNAIRSRV